MQKSPSDMHRYRFVHAKQMFYHWAAMYLLCILFGHCGKWKCWFFFQADQLARILLNIGMVAFKLSMEWGHKQSQYTVTAGWQWLNSRCLQCCWCNTLRWTRAKLLNLYFVYFVKKTHHIVQDLVYLANVLSYKPKRN